MEVHINPLFIFDKGTCHQMCPEKERKFREREGLLHKLEIKTGTEKHKRPTADPNCTVKCFSRSAAGQEMQKLSDLRPPPILLQTILYLFNNVLTNKTMEWSTLYEFVFDRLRAVRQDMVIQGVEASDSITLLELIVRFHAYAGFRLCEEPLSKFDPQINHIHLLECLKCLLTLYDFLDEQDIQEYSSGSQEMKTIFCDSCGFKKKLPYCDCNININNMVVTNETFNDATREDLSLKSLNNSEIQAVRSCFNTPPPNSGSTSSKLGLDVTEDKGRGEIEINNFSAIVDKTMPDGSAVKAVTLQVNHENIHVKEEKYGKTYFHCLNNRAEMEALYLILNLGDANALSRALKFGLKLRVSPLSDVLSLSLAYWVRNFVTVYRSIFKLPPLLACVAVSHLPFLRRQTLQVMSVAYNCHNLSYPLRKLQVLLLYASEQEARDDCRHYNIEVKDCEVVFNKNAFNSRVSKSPLRQEKFVGDKLAACSLPQLLLGQ